MKTHRRGLTTALLHPFRGRGTKGVLAALGVTVACLAESQMVILGSAS